MHRVKNKKDAREFAEGVINDPILEVQWAETAFKHAETYFKLLQIVPDKAAMRLTRHDDDLYTGFRELFPDLSVAVLDEDQVKSKESKDKYASLRATPMPLPSPSCSLALAVLLSLSPSLSSVSLSLSLSLSLLSLPL